jgi:hypothetical protein
MEIIFNLDYERACLGGWGGLWRFGRKDLGRKFFL